MEKSVWTNKHYGKETPVYMTQYRVYVTHCYCWKCAYKYSDKNFTEKIFSNRHEMYKWRRSHIDWLSNSPDPEKVFRYKEPTIEIGELNEDDS